MHYSVRPGWHDPKAHRPPRRCSADVSATSLFRCDAFGKLPRGPPPDLSLASILTFDRQVDTSTRQVASINSKISSGRAGVHLLTNRVFLLAPATPSAQRLKEANAKAAPRCALKLRLDAHYISKFFHLRASFRKVEKIAFCQRI